MANVTIPALPPAISLDGSEQLEIVQPAGGSGTSKRTTTFSIAALATAANSLPVGGTTGQALVKLSNANFDANWGTISSVGTVTSVGLALPADFTVSNSPVTTTGTLTAVYAVQAANLVHAGPTNGAAAAPTYRALVGADLPNPAVATKGGVFSLAPIASNFLTSIATNGAVTQAQPAFSDLTGTITVAQGGTAITSYAVGDILYASGATTLSKLADVATGNALISGGVTTAPSWGKIGLTTHISGTLAVGNGGTGLTAGTSGGVLAFTATNTLASSGLLTANGVVLGGGAGVVPTSTAAGTNGQVLMGVTAGAPTFQGTNLSITFIIDGGGSAITTGIKGDLTVPFSATITEWTLLADQSGSIVVDIWKDTYANYPPTVADTITAAAKPTITTATKGQSSTLTAWTTTITAGDTIRFNVDSITTVTRVTLSLKVTRTSA